MAETFEIRSKSFTIKWVDVPINSKVEWKIKPLKNSLTLGIYEYKNDTIEHSKLNGSSNSLKSSNETHKPGLSSESLSVLIENLDINEVHQIPHRFFTQLPKSSSSFQSTTSLPSGNNHNHQHHRKDEFSKDVDSLRTSINSSNGTLEERLDRFLIKKTWLGRCPGDIIKSGKINSHNGGLYAFVFDNTFSKTKAKTVLLKYEIKPLSTSVPPPRQRLMNSSISKAKFEGIEQNKGHQNYHNSTRILNVNGIQYLEGFLMKNKRKKTKRQFNRRFFSLNITYSILNYYLGDSSNRIRGNMLITQTVISADSSELMFYLDSGMEQWILKALNKNDFNTWINAFNFIKTQNKKLKDSKSSIDQRLAIGGTSENMSDDDSNSFENGNSSSFYDSKTPRCHRHSDRTNSQFQVIESQISELKECVSALLDVQKSHDQHFGGRVSTPSTPELSNSSKFPTTQQGSLSISTSSTSNKPDNKVSTLEAPQIPNNTPSRKPSFLQRLKKKSSQSYLQQNDNSLNISSPITTPDTQTFDLEQPRSLTLTKSGSSASSSGLVATDGKLTLDTIMEKILELESNYSDLLKQEIGRSSSRSLARSDTQARSLLSQEFYDAEEYVNETSNGVVMLDSSAENREFEKRQSIISSDLFQKDMEKLALDVIDSSTSSSSEDEEENEESTSLKLSRTDSHEEKEHDLCPLPYDGPFNPRNDVPPAACEPPSLISILRKGIGKDMAGISMPIETNEPLSFLQKYTECFEYSTLIDNALRAPMETGERILTISAFAVSYLSSYKDKVRSIRKPFNPLLGETFELIRPDMGIRVVTEKVIHKPFVMAAHVDSQNWYIDHSIRPQQKFYGKTAEIQVDGTLQLKLRNSDEAYEWSQPNTVLRNVVSLTGEKYTEPVDTMTVKSNKGYKCVITFISQNGRFTSSRSERLEMKVYNGNSSKPLSLTADGTWTEEIKLNTGKSIWKISPELPNHEKKYGFTRFSCSLNHFDEVHKSCAPTDSRRRPDQKMYEQGNVGEAEKLKQKLEEDQRTRRKDASGNDVVHQPAFFEKGINDLDWKLKKGHESYWNRRKSNNWDGLVKLW